MQSTDDRGQFRLPEAVAGKYALVTQRKGFRPNHGYHRLTRQCEETLGAPCSYRNKR